MVFLLEDSEWKAMMREIKAPPDTRSDESGQFRVGLLHPPDIGRMAWSVILSSWFGGCGGRFLPFPCSGLARSGTAVRSSHALPTP